MIATRLAQDYFERIREVWSPFAGNYRVIPFCTPVIKSPSALIIGTNHSDFVDGGGNRSERIADELARALPKQSTFLVHDHKFARGMSEVCGRAGIEIDDTWVGTNRCAVQTGPGGIAEIRTHARFAGCQIEMDQILREFLIAVLPRNVILTGKYAVGLCYARSKQATFDELQPRDIECPGVDYPIRIIPIPHPSRASFWQRAADRLSKHFAR